ncbi:MAG TPA: efflux RND transporter periplasmic adaptor subunit [Candidatus Angelobacter sp.]|jgi:cobalt-zinc-cadmium efflux system membrane fusion protein
MLALLITGCSKTPNQPPAETEQGGQRQEAKSPDNLLRIEHDMLRDLRITTSTVERRHGGEGVSLLGEVAVNEDAYSQVGAPVSARVVEINVSPGQSVTQGQQLAILQSTELGKARSDKATAEARLHLAQQTLERKRRLAGERIVAQRDVQEAEAAVATAEADLRAARAALQALGAGEDETGGSQLVLRSPIHGTVIERSALRGQLADPAQPLFKIAELKTVWLNVHAFERDAVLLQAGKAARVTLPALPGRTFPAKVTLIGSAVDPASRTIPVRIAVENGSGVLRPGMSATAWVPFGEAYQQIIAVPTAAVQRIENDWYVFIPKSQDTFELRQVGRGRDLEGEIEIVKGLQPGETVVVDGAFLLKAEAEKARGEGKEHEHD